MDHLKGTIGWEEGETRIRVGAVSWLGSSLVLVFGCTLLVFVALTLKLGLFFGILAVPGTWVTCAVILKYVGGWYSVGERAFMREFGGDFGVGRSEGIEGQVVAIRFAVEGVELFMNGRKAAVGDGDGVEVFVQELRGFLGRRIGSLVSFREGGQVFRVMACDLGRTADMAEGTPWVFRSVGGGREEERLKALAEQGYFRREREDG